MVQEVWGVINIITKPPIEQEASITGHYELPENSLEGSSWRTGINLAGPMTDKLSYRTTLGYHKSNADDPDLNKSASINNTSIAAGREGVENIDARQLFEYAIDTMNTIGVDVNYSQQSNLWAGDSQFQGINQTLINALEGKKTNEMERYGIALTHRGDYEKGRSNSYIEYTRTNNTRLQEGAAGGGEGQISTGNITVPNWVKSKYENLNAKSEWDIFFNRHTLTTGIEFRGERLYNPLVSQSELPTDFEFGEIVVDQNARDPESDAYLIGVYVEDNYQVTDNWFVTPGLRFDYHNTAGSNWSPSLNTTWEFTDNWSLKGGISHAFKVPGLYQLDPNYIYYTNGNGCPSWVPSNQRGCHVLGNPNLENEKAWNKEITITYDDGTGLTTGLTYYRNDYKNRVAAGDTPVAQVSVDPTQNNNRTYRTLFQWENQGKAIIEGIEAFLQVPITDALKWNYNFTGNLRSERKDNGEPLSLIPKYTVNSSLDWDITDNWNTNLSASYYGEIKAPKKSGITGEDLAPDTQLDREAYVLFNLNTQYKLNENVSFGLGVKNLFDEQVKREGTVNNAGARTFNEPGRYYTFDIKMNF